MKIKAEHRGNFNGHRDAVYVLSKEGMSDSFFSGGGDGMIIKWNSDPASPGEVIARLPAAIYSLLYFSAEGMLLAGTRFGSLYFLDLKGKKVSHQLFLNGDIFGLAPVSISESSNTEIIAAATTHGLYFISLKDYQILDHHRPSEKSCRTVVSEENGMLATGWSDNFIRIYDNVSKKEVHAFEAHESSVFSLAYSGSYLLSGSRDARLRVWDAANNYAPEETLAAHWFTINALELAPDKKLFASASRDKSVRIWSTPPSVKLLRAIERPAFPAHTHSVNCLLWLEDDILLSAGDDKVIKKWAVYEEE